MPDTTKTGAEGVTWNLGDLYASGTDPLLDADLDAADRRADAFAAKYRGKVAGLAAEKMAELLAEYEAILDLAGKFHAWRQFEPAEALGRVIHAIQLSSGDGAIDGNRLHRQFVDAHVVTHEPTISSYRRCA